MFGRGGGGGGKKPDHQQHHDHHHHVISEEEWVREDRDRKEVDLYMDGNGKKEAYMTVFCTVKEIDIPGQKFTVAAYFNFFWRRNLFRSEAQKKKPREKGLHQIEDLPPTDQMPWNPEALFDNSSSEPEFMLEPEYYYEDLSDLHRICFAVEATMSERFELDKFPYDRQFLNLQLKAKNYEDGWKWLVSRPDWVPENLPIDHPCAKGQPEYDDYSDPIQTRFSESVVGFQMQPAWLDYFSEELSIKMRVEREPAYYLTSIVEPSFFFVLSSGSTYFVDVSERGARLTIIITMLLVQVAFQFIILEALPEGGGATYVHYYSLTCMLVQILLLALEIVIHDNYEENYVDNLDGYIYLVFLIVWVFIHVLIAMQSTPYQWVRQSWVQMYAEDGEGGEDFEYQPGAKDKHMFHDVNKWDDKKFFNRLNMKVEESNQGVAVQTNGKDKVKQAHLMNKINDL